MASFTVLVTQSPFDHQAASSAIRFTHAVLEAGHTVNGVFFYQGGTLNANALTTGFQDEANLYAAWQALHDTHQVSLQVCVSAANRRGVISAEDADENDQPHYNLQAPFESVGLGEFMQLLEHSDRTIQF